MASKNKEERVSAATKKVEYDTVECSVCGTETAIDPVPDNILDPIGFAVIIGEGNLDVEPNTNGNWDTELQFKLDKENKVVPDVRGYFICEDCAEIIHGYSSEEGYTGDAPSEILSSPVSGDVENKTAWILVISVIVLIILVYII